MKKKTIFQNNASNNDNLRIFATTLKSINEEHYDQKYLNEMGRCIDIALDLNELYYRRIKFLEELLEEKNETLNRIGNIL